MAWRDFYADVLFQQPRTAWENLNSKFDDDAGRHRRRTLAKRFDRWTAGETGFGIVDAGMRQLAATGWMHNRVRMIVASFLVKDLHLPWQWGARWFMQHLSTATSHRTTTAGSGRPVPAPMRLRTSGCSTRTLQQERYDPDGEYVARWVPDPVEPMLDHKAERNEALRRLKSSS